ncbi:hypothetical protein PMI13_00223 [Chryseobacterium populi]|uniref:Uncharacterized protein n=2 Tax=Chryseobacterium populi TaxID=1144316 RepID=J2TCA7_9FLAO|nr:hypothetical protein PMI13_00223 [Chryseobacterium populi]
MVGLLNNPVTFYTKNHFEIIGIRCYPWMVFDLLELPSSKNKLFTFEHPVAELQTRLNTFIQADQIKEAIHYVKQRFLTTRPQIAPNTMLFKAGAAMKIARLFSVTKKQTRKVSEITSATSSFPSYFLKTY